MPEFDPQATFSVPDVVALIEAQESHKTFKKEKSGQKILTKRVVSMKL